MATRAPLARRLDRHFPVQGRRLTRTNNPKIDRSGSPIAEPGSSTIRICSFSNEAAFAMGSDPIER